MNRPRSVLDEKPLRVPISGRIRTGIKVLTRAGAENPRIAKLFADGIAAGKTYDDIDRQIKTELELTKSPLVPKNTPYFRVESHDFTYPENAVLVFEKYAEDRSNGLGRQLYRFPVVFAFDDWMQNMPHGLRAFTGAELKYQSQYDAVGDRYCMQHADTSQGDPRNRRAVRRLGGRELVMRRNASGGLCVPELCAEYQAKACKLSGRLLFFVPGVPGSSLIEMSTTSFYSLDQIHAQMELVAGLRNGRISGTHNSKAIFWLSKVSQEVTMLDDAGAPKKVMQFLVRLETELPMTELMAAAEQRALATGAPPLALAAPPAQESAAAAATLSAEPDVDTKQRIRTLRTDIATMLEKGGWDVEKFGMEMASEHGPDWSRHETKLKTVKTNLKRDLERKS